MGWYFTITEEMRALGLNGNDLLVFALINSYSQEGNGVYYGGIDFLCEVCGISRRTSFSVLSGLVERGLIIKNDVYHNGVKYVTYGVSAKSAQGVQNLHKGGVKSAPNIESKYINDNTLSNKETKKFKKPTLEEVREYCQSRGNGVDPETFINFYESKGWMVGKTPMKDWKAAVRTWEQRSPSRTPKPSAPQRESVFAHNMREIQKMREKYGAADNQ